MATDNGGILSSNVLPIGPRPHSYLCCECMKLGFRTLRQVNQHCTTCEARETAAKADAEAEDPFRGILAFANVPKGKRLCRVCMKRGKRHLIGLAEGECVKITIPDPPRVDPLTYPEAVEICNDLNTSDWLTETQVTPEAAHAATDPAESEPCPGGQFVLPSSSAARKAIPLCRGLLDYFPAALAEIAKVSRVGNEQHNPGQEMHHARGKSTDHADCIIRHLIERGTDDTDGLSHTAKVAWRALAMLQEELEAKGAPMARAAKAVAEMMDVKFDTAG